MIENQNTGLNSGLSSGGDASIFGTNQLSTVLGIAKEKLQLAASNSELLYQVFGDKANTAELQGVIKQWSVGDFSQLPSVQILSAANMKGADGAYASSTQNIYLSDALFQSNAAPVDSVLGAVGVFTEEAFHWLDDRVGKDTQGDEGELAKNLLFDVKLSDSELSRIKSEDDRGFINVGGQKLLVEQASIVGNSAGNTLIGTNLADVIYGYQGNDTLNGNGGNDLLNGYGFTDNERDTLTGGTGADRFVLGDANSVFYAKNGNSDYAVITDFNRAEGDAIALKKLAFNNTSGDLAYGYRLVTVGVNTEIRVDNTNELVATLQNRTGVSLLQGFVFEGTPALRTGQANTDVDGDGKDDIIAANNGSGVFVKLSTGSSFGATQQWQSGGFAGNEGTFLADVNGDGKADIIAANKGSGVFVKLSTGSSFGETQQWQYGGFAGNEGTFLGGVKATVLAPVGLPTSAAAADSFFKCQFNNTKYNPDGPSGSQNCGPASLAMIIKTLGLEPSGISVETSIDHARYLMYPTDTRATVQQGVKTLNLDSYITDDIHIGIGITNAGGIPISSSGWTALDQNLNAGNPMVARGNITSNWRSQFSTPSDYGSGGNSHYLAILGKTFDGKYIVADPMYRGGTVAMTKDQVSVFFGGGSPTFIAFSKK